MISTLASAHDFVCANARLLDQRLFAVLFQGEDPESVVMALRGFQNPDGGFGHGLEPDKRAPSSQPLDVEMAFAYLVSAGVSAVDLVNSACGWLETVASPDGAVPLVLPSIDEYPKAEHWSAADFTARVNPTATIAAYGHILRGSHPWVDQATDYCFAEFEAGRIPLEAHALRGFSKLIAATDNHRRSDDAGEWVASVLPEARYMKLSAESAEYGVTPLDFAPTPSALARSWFADDVIESHLERLIAGQQDDGGWPISWQPVSEAAGWEWRGFRTLTALQVLSAYGRL